MYYILLFLLSPLLLLLLFNSMLLYNLCTICCMTVLCSRNPIPGSSEFLSPYSHILYILQRIPPPTILSTLLYLLLLLLKAVLLLHSAPLPFSILLVVVLLPFLFHLWTLPLLMPLFAISETLYSLFHYFMPSYLSYSTLHYPAFQYLKLVLETPLTSHFSFSFFIVTGDDEGVLCFLWLVVSEYKTTSKQIRELLGS